MVVPELFDSADGPLLMYAANDLAVERRGGPVCRISLARVRGHPLKVQAVMGQLQGQWGIGVVRPQATGNKCRSWPGDDASARALHDA